MLFVLFLVVMVLFALGRLGMTRGGFRFGLEHRRANEGRQSEDQDEFFHVCTSM